MCYSGTLHLVIFQIDLGMKEEDAGGDHDYCEVEVTSSDTGNKVSIGKISEYDGK